ncbi:MAG: glycogen/starch/alpha-glucan phosphorylase [Ruminococcaceae bacterium]|nr:glycogen/starch/alpha-glucan phosphorylase [Oscillospiraceae bacterium]
MNYNPEKEEVKALIENVLQRHFGVSSEEASSDQIFKAVSTTVRNILTSKRSDYTKKVNHAGAKRVYYMCMEFLLGRSLKNNLANLGLEKVYKEALKDMGTDLIDLYDCESDAGLGNGGLGRLAACFMDSLSTLDYPASAFSILYEYGLFRQMIVDGVQVELPDVWLPQGDVWLIPRTDRIYKVKFGGKVTEQWKDGHLEILYENAEEIEAVPYDMMISGSDSLAVSSLRLWKARNIQNFNMGLFTQGQYTKALEESNNAEIISKVLYPSDNHTEGKLLRLSQQYFLVSASVQSIVRDHMAVYNTLDNFSDKVSIHINDTHPALCIPELMRIFIDEYFFSWDKAWDTVVKTVSYTNHTVMPEALETWSEDLFSLKLPRIHSIIKEINERFCKKAWEVFPGNWDTISKMSIIANGEIRMANLSIVGSHSINGVSKLHSDILKSSTFKNFYKMYPARFLNVTNGIAHRRWLCSANPSLASLIDECIGVSYRKEPEKLIEFKKFEDDLSVLQKIRDIKHQNKVSFSELIFKKTGKILNTHSIFDVQIKRLHEYKRQLLSALNIIGLYLDLKENPSLDFQSQTFIFGAKAAPGYDMAKRIIKLIWCIGRDIETNPNPEIREKLSVVFLEDYNVSLAEALIPSAEISEQISLAGKEASGTGCMKLMINGALTIGTLDGANVEMRNCVGDDNIFIFGLNSKEVEDLWLKGYNSASFYTANPRLNKIINALSTGFAGESFSDIASYLLNSYPVADPYMCLADFESYHLTHKDLTEKYRNRENWSRKSLINIASAGYFAADRSIEEYASKIWNIKKIK